MGEGAGKGEAGQGEGEAVQGQLLQGGRQALWAVLRLSRDLCVLGRDGSSHLSTALHG